jgi:hypothetical protein
MLVDPAHRIMTSDNADRNRSGGASSMAPDGSARAQAIRAFVQTKPVQDSYTHCPKNIQ